MTNDGLTKLLTERQSYGSKATYFMFGICDDILWIFFLKIWGLLVPLRCDSSVLVPTGVKRPSASRHRSRCGKKRSFFHGCLDVNQLVNLLSLATFDTFFKRLKDLEQWKVNKT